MLRDFRQPAIPEVLAWNPQARDNFALCDIPGLLELAKKYDGHETEKRKLETGDMSTVAESNAFLAEMEKHVFVSVKHRTVDDVCGGFPNVQNHIAGLPCAMRRRVRQSNSNAPLAVLVELAPSGSVTSQQMRKRGAAVLALVQLLANKRPVELWATITLGNAASYNSILCRLETAPLDLARVAYVMCDDHVVRHLGYDLIQSHFGTSASGFAYGSEDNERKYAARAHGRAIDNGGEIAYVTFMHASDQALDDPIAWIKTNLAKYAGETYETEE